jgi:threonine/homoserine/homoserine lactone efflux protein
MVPEANLVAYVITAVLLVLLPGPSVLFVIGRALDIGRTGALLSVAGNALGFLVQVVAIAAGLGSLLNQSEVLLTIVKFVGAGFLIYLGIGAIRHRNDDVVIGAVAPKRGWARTLLEGGIVGVTNPKTIVFFIAVLPQFVDSASGNIPLQLFVLGAIFAGLALILDSVWALSASFARDWFGRSPHRLSRLSMIGGVAMLVLGVGVAVTGFFH